MDKQTQVQNAVETILSLCEESAAEGKTSWEWKGHLKTPIDPKYPDTCLPHIYKGGLCRWCGTKDVIAKLESQGLDVYYDNGYDWYLPGPATLRVSWEEREDLDPYRYVKKTKRWITPS
jgi:hypothetical protein